MRDFAATGAALGQPVRFVETLEPGMTYFYLILSGVVMGLVAAVPIGPVNLICIRRSFAFGPLNGFVSGLGAALGDGIVRRHHGLRPDLDRPDDRGLCHHHRTGRRRPDGVVGLSHLHLAAGAALPGERQSTAKAPIWCRAMVSTFALTVTNPVTLLSFGVMFAGLGGLAGGAGSYQRCRFCGRGGGGGLGRLVAGPDHADRPVPHQNRRKGHADHQPGLRRLVMAFGLAVLVHLAIKFW